MRLYYQNSFVTLYHGDCHDSVSPDLGAFDHLITDPPYSEHVHTMTRTNRGAKNTTVDYGFDALSDDLRRYVARWTALHIKRWSIVFAPAEDIHLWIETFDWESFEADRPMEHVRVGQWIKPNPMPQISADRPGTGYESIEIAHTKGKKRWNGGSKAAVWYSPAARGTERLHPAQKPLKLMCDLILDFTDEGETIYDPFAGAGTTLLAAQTLGRKCVGVEISEQWCEKTAHRLEAHPLLA